MKKFNITGICIPEKHYMVDTSKKIQKILEMIEEGCYFTINRPRQYGKTTTLSLLFHALKQKPSYLIIKTSFEGLGEDAFVTPESLAKNFLSQIMKSLESLKNESGTQFINNYGPIQSLDELSTFISKFVLNSTAPVVLFIDEVDKASNHLLFLNFLGMLRNKYLSAADGLDHTFHSVVLAGVYDIKNLKLKMRPDSESKYNSPWNIATEFKVDLSFSAEEIESMLNQYAVDNRQLRIDVPLLSKEIYNYTKGYPFLVSKICKVIDEDLEKDWSIEGIKKAINLTLDEKNTLFDDLIKNLENYSDLYDLTYRILVLGEYIPFQIYNPTIDHANMLGIVSKQENATKVSNKIFEICIYNYLISKKSLQEGSLSSYKDTHYYTRDGKLNMEHILNKFQEIMQDEYREKDNKFIEREGRLLFLCFLKPIINGKGFYYIEPETREDTRMDIVVNFGNEEYIIELKIWRGKKYEEKGLDKLADYLSSKRQNKGYLVTFSFLQDKQYTAEWIKIDNKDVYSVVV